MTIEERIAALHRALSDAYLYNGDSSTIIRLEDQIAILSEELKTDKPAHGYHNKEIKKGVLGTPSKIREEYEEFIDAIEQGNSVMALLELSDLIGAIEAYTQHRFNVSLLELMVMKDATKRAFKDGTRSSISG